MRAIIQAHNTKQLNTEKRPDSNACNCRVKNQCPVQGNCQKPVVYKATIEIDGTNKTYIGSTNNFKSRFSAHKHSFKSNTNKNATALSAFVWDRGLNPNPVIKWEILRVVQPYRPGQRNCQLCLAEKIEIGANLDDPNNLNKRTEMAAACRHRWRFKLARI